MDQKISSKKLQDNWADMFKAKEVKMKKSLKGRRGSNSTQRMMERRERRKYVMKEIEVDGEKRYYLIKKKEKQVLFAVLNISKCFHY